MKEYFQSSFYHILTGITIFFRKEMVFPCEQGFPSPLGPKIALQKERPTTTDHRLRANVKTLLSENKTRLGAKILQASANF